MFYAPPQATMVQTATILFSSTNEVFQFKMHNSYTKSNYCETNYWYIDFTNIINIFRKICRVINDAESTLVMDVLNYYWLITARTLSWKHTCELQFGALEPLPHELFV